MVSFKRAMEERDVDAAIGLLADDVSFRSPAVFGEYVGRQAVDPVIRAVADAFQDFRYVREFTDEDGTAEALFFEARVGDRRIEGADFIVFDAAGNISELVVMIRPLSGLVALVSEMRRLLESLSPAVATDD
jgi:hypothetical protein